MSATAHQKVESFPVEGFVLNEQIIHRLRRAHQRCTAIFADVVGDPQLTATQWAVLVTLHGQDGLSQNQLGRATYMDPATTQGVIMRLVERKLVERHPDPTDRRRTNVSLTASGRTLVERVAERVAAANAEMLSPLSEDERRQLLVLIAKLM